MSEIAKATNAAEFCATPAKVDTIVVQPAQAPLQIEESSIGDVSVTATEGKRRGSGLVLSAVLATGAALLVARRLGQHSFTGKEEKRESQRRLDEKLADPNRDNERVYDPEKDGYKPHPRTNGRY